MQILSFLGARFGANQFDGGIAGQRGAQVANSLPIQRCARLCKETGARWQQQLTSVCARRWEISRSIPSQMVHSNQGDRILQSGGI